MKNFFLTMLLVMSCQTTKPTETKAVQPVALVECQEYANGVVSEYLKNGFALVDEKSDKYTAYSVYAKDQQAFLDVIMPEMVAGIEGYQEFGKCRLGNMVLRHYKREISIQD